MISPAENSNKFQKTWFWKEKSVEGMVTLGPTHTGHTTHDDREKKKLHTCSLKVCLERGQKVFTNIVHVNGLGLTLCVSVNVKIKIFI